MRLLKCYPAVTSLAVAAVLSLGCGDSSGPVAKPTGTISVRIYTAGENADRDPDGYLLSVDSGEFYHVAIDATSTFDLPIGGHRVRLSGLAPNCSVNGPNPLLIYTTTEQPTSAAAFDVACHSLVDDGGGWWDY